MCCRILWLLKQKRIRQISHTPGPTDYEPKPTPKPSRLRSNLHYTDQGDLKHYEAENMRIRAVSARLGSLLHACTYSKWYIRA